MSFSAINFRPYFFRPYDFWWLSQSHNDCITVDQKPEGRKKIGQIFKIPKSFMADFRRSRALTSVNSAQIIFFHLNLSFSNLLYELFRLFYGLMSFSAINFWTYFFRPQDFRWLSQSHQTFVNFVESWKWPSPNVLHSRPSCLFIVYPYS